MVWRFTIILIFAVLGCQGQYDRGSRQGNNARGYQNHDDSRSDRRMQKRDETAMMYHNCFISKGCFGIPSGCETRRDCDVLLTYTHNDKEKEFNFKMSGRLEHDNYMAMGLSYDGKMGEDAVTECYLKDNTVSVRESWNEGQSNTRTQQLAEHLFRGTYKDGWSICEWSEDYVVESNNRKFNLYNSTLHILLARGPMQGDRIRYHTLGRLGSEEPVNFTAFEAISGAGVSDSVKIHGSSEEDITTEIQHDHNTHDHKEHKSESSAASDFTFKYITLILTLAVFVCSRSLKL